MARLSEGDQTVRFVDPGSKSYSKGQVCELLSNRDQSALQPWKSKTAAMCSMWPLEENVDLSLTDEATVISVNRETVSWI